MTEELEREKLIPDFDDMERLAREAAKTKAEILVLKNQLTQLEASCMRVALTDETYWIGNRRPSMAYCEEVVKRLGNTEEDRQRLFDLRQQIAEKTEAYQLLQHLIDLGRDRLSLFQTLSANTRKSFLS